MKINCTFIDDTDDAVKKDLCLLWRFPIAYADASPEDIALFLNNNIAYLVKKFVLTAKSQQMVAVLNQQGEAELKALQASQEQIKIKAVSATK